MGFLLEVTGRPRPLVCATHASLRRAHLSQGLPRLHFTLDFLHETQVRPGCCPGSVAACAWSSPPSPSSEAYWSSSLGQEVS